MKKFFNSIWAFIKKLFSCERSCDEAVGTTDNKTRAVAPLNVEHLIAMDKQSMYNKYGNDWRWYETCMMLNNFLDEENDGTLQEVVNVFQAVINREQGFDTEVYKFQHFADGTYAEDSIHGFWVEDYPMENDAIKISYREAYERVMAVNCPKPHSRYVTLRKQVGPKACNPQYIFGNLRAQLYVDAVTGDVSEVNPAFGEDIVGYAFTWASKKKRNYADINQDGAVDVADVASVIDAMAANPKKNPDGTLYGDANNDGVVDVADIGTVQDAMAGKTPNTSFGTPLGEWP